MWCIKISRTLSFVSGGEMRLNKLAVIATGFVQDYIVGNPVSFPDLPNKINGTIVSPYDDGICFSHTDFNASITWCEFHDNRKTCHYQNISFDGCEIAADQWINSVLCGLCGNYPKIICPMPLKQIDINLHTLLDNISIHNFEKDLFNNTVGDWSRMGCIQDSDFLRYVFNNDNDLKYAIKHKPFCISEIGFV